MEYPTQEKRKSALLDQLSLSGVLGSAPEEGLPFSSLRGVASVLGPLLTAPFSFSDILSTYPASGIDGKREKPLTWNYVYV